MGDWVEVKKDKKKGRSRNNFSGGTTMMTGETTCKESNSISLEKTHPLNDTWILWHHKRDDKDWSINSYRKISSFNTVEDMWICLNNYFCDPSVIEFDSFYLMRQGIPPRWDDPPNNNGSAWTFKIRMKQRSLFRFWLDLVFFSVGETICSDSETIVGISTSPKMSNGTVRVWLSEVNNNIERFNHLKDYGIDFNDSWFKKNSDEPH